jgi:hypothetical protein
MPALSEGCDTELPRGIDQIQKIFFTIVIVQHASSLSLDRYS